MSRRPQPADPRVAAAAVAVAVLLAALALLALAAPAAEAADRLHPPAEASASSIGEEARIRAYWTPERMRSTPPLPEVTTGSPTARRGLIGRNSRAGWPVLLPARIA